MSYDSFMVAVRRARGDAPQLIALLTQFPDDALQQIGDALLATVDLELTPDLIDVAARLVAALRDRGWDGDPELCDALDDATGRRSSALVRLAVELDDVADARGQTVGACSYLDLTTGSVWINNPGEMFDDENDFEDSTHWLAVGRALRGHIATLSGSSRLSRTASSVFDSTTPSAARARSGTSAACSNTMHPPSTPAGTASQPTAASDTRVLGWPRSATRLDPSADPNDPAPSSATRQQLRPRGATPSRRSGIPARSRAERS